eukprot:3086067-Pleurochrysis_carterae.AAC.6
MKFVNPAHRFHVTAPVDHSYSRDARTGTEYRSAHIARIGESVHTSLAQEKVELDITERHIPCLRYTNKWIGASG